MTPVSRYRAALVLLAALFATLAYGTTLRVATLNVELGLGAPGTAAHEAAIDILSRLDADVVALQEIQGDDLSGVPSALDSFATALGYPAVHVSDTTGVFDFMQRVCLLSRYPIISATNIVPPPGAKDMTRQIPAIVVDVPGITDDPSILNLHLKCCLEPDDPFRRAVELHRISRYLETNALSSSDNVIVLGDFNLIGSDLVYQSLPAGLPATFELGTDVTFPVRYFMSPANYFTPWSMTALDARQLNGSDNTSGSSTLDFILATGALTNRPHASEIYNSALDTSNGQGLPKSGSPLSSGTSNDASDHFALFADFELVALPPLSLDISPEAISESDPSGAAVLTVTLPFAPGPGESVTATLATSDPSEAVVTRSTITFPAGVLSLDVDLAPRPDALLDGDQLVTFIASAPGFAPDSANLIVTDDSPTFFAITTAGQTILEDFSAFDGSADPARWPATGGMWQGIDDGSSATPGNYSYGSDPSLGFLLGGRPISTTADYRNNSGGPITALEISYHAEQWRSSQNGAADQIVVELLVDGVPISLPALTFTGNTSLPTGPIAGGATSPALAIVSGLAVPHGETFQLRFTAIPGAGGGGAIPADIFINEFHYDNSDTDRGEFVEIVVGPGYPGSLSDAAIVFYNGNGGGAYTTHALDTFTLDETTSSGHRIFSKSIAGIQNGSPDGFAVVAGTNVLHFLSYEGAFSATNGPASGMNSIDIGVRQDSPVPAAGSQSLGLTGSGGVATDFSWTRFTGPYTRGVSNPGQSFTAPAGSQGLAIDNLAVTILLDTDEDGNPDRTDPDDDNDGLPDPAEATLGTDPLRADSDGNGTADGEEDFDHDRQSNFAEVVLTLTDPLDPNSRFRIAVAPVPGQPGRAILSFPTLPGRTYTINRSPNLRTWSILSGHPGDGSIQDIQVGGDPLAPANFFRVEASMP